MPFKSIADLYTRVLIIAEDCSELCNRSCQIWKNSNIEMKVLGSQENSKFSNFIFVDNQLQAVESINSPGHHLIMKSNWGKWHLLKKDLLTSDFNLKYFFDSLT